jgi:hypothetical protein
VGELSTAVDHLVLALDKHFVAKWNNEPSPANAPLNPMNWKSRFIGATRLFGAAFVLATNVISAQAGGLTIDGTGNLFVADGHTV